jgi:hypothetical protein
MNEILSKPDSILVYQADTRILNDCQLVISIAVVGCRPIKESSIIIGSWIAHVIHVLCPMLRYGFTKFKRVSTHPSKDITIGDNLLLRVTIFHLTSC